MESKFHTFRPNKLNMFSYVIQCLHITLKGSVFINVPDLSSTFNLCSILFYFPGSECSRHSLD